MKYLSRYITSSTAALLASAGTVWAGPLGDSATTGLNLAKEEGLLVGGVVIGVAAALVVVFVVLNMVRSV